MVAKTCFVNRQVVERDSKRKGFSVYYFRLFRFPEAALRYQQISKKDVCEEIDVIRIRNSSNEAKEDMAHIVIH